MASVNKVTLLGNCGRDPEIRHSASGMAMCNISLATSTKRKDKNTGEYVEETQWHRVQFYDKLAEIVAQYVKKGNPLYVEGRLKYGKFTNKDGVEQQTTDIVAETMQLLGSREQGQRAPSAPTQAPTRQAPKQQSGGFDDFDEDMPF